MLSSTGINFMRRCRNLINNWYQSEKFEFPTRLIKGSIKSSLVFLKNFLHFLSLSTKHKSLIRTFQNFPCLMEGIIQILINWSLPKISFDFLEIFQEFSSTFQMFLLIRRMVCCGFWSISNLDYAGVMGKSLIVLQKCKNSSFETEF